jgi:DNA polymerase-3 subunit alpha (Gram-positive type)
MAKEIIIEPSANIFASLGIKEIEIQEIRYNERYKRLSIDCFLLSTDFFHEIDTLENKLKNHFGEKLIVEIKLTLKTTEIKKEELRKIVERAIKKLKEKNAISRSFLYFYRIALESDYINIELNDEMSVKTLYDSNINIKLEKKISNYGINGFKIKFIVGDFSKKLEELDSQKNSDLIRLKEKSDEQSLINRTQSNNVSTSKSTASKDNPNVQKFQYKNKGLNGTIISIDEFSELLETEICLVSGEIFSLEIRDIRGEKNLVTLRITDKKNSVTLKIFMNKDKKLEVKEGDLIKAVGRKQVDKFANNEEIIMITAIEKLENTTVIKKDHAIKKMVELHTHSKMSEMVGVTDIKNIINRAEQYGHSSVAITDYGVVHSFPFAYKAAKGKDIKVILGSELYMVDDISDIVTNSDNRLIAEEVYTVFDLETTGLNGHSNEIIEIGAIKLSGSRIVDKYSAFVKPERKIPKKITELTGISSDMVENAQSIEEVLPKFLEFIGDSTLVAHNAPFDMSFIVRETKRILNKEINNPVIDTLRMARDVLPNIKSYGLKVLTKHLGVALESHHRAVDDSQATANMFLIFLEKYIEKGAITLKDMNSTFPVNIQKQSTSNIMVLVKDKIGLKNMYKIISESHLNYYGGKKPRITKSFLIEHREGLIFGSSLSTHFNNSGELANNYLEYDFKKVEKNIDFYDYIELLPRVAHTELFDEDDSGRMKNHNEVENMNKYFYELAKKYGKIVTGSSNVHYLEPEESKIRSILLYGSGSVFRANQYQSDNGFYFRTTEELLQEFSYLGQDIAEEIVVTNTNLICEQIEKIKPVPDGFYPPKIDNAENIVREMTYEKSYKIYGNPLPKIVEERVERELKSIIGNGFAVLYLSAQKLVKKSLDAGYIVGSRGSVGSSIVAYMMDITEVNALYPHYICENTECKYSEFIEREGSGVDLEQKECPHCGLILKRDGHSIPFEVFMGFDGDKVPDIDLNFSGDYQSEIHRYCEELFGKENVFKAGTISTLAEKNAEGYVKKYFEEHEIKISGTEIIRLAKKVEGAKKTTGQHPGGMIVVPQGNSIFEFCPVQKPANDMKNDSITTHYDYHVMDEQLVKLDILGHDDPTTIKLLQEYTGIKIEDIPLADPETLKLFSSTESLGVTPEQIFSEVGTYGVPEFGTGFVRQMLLDTKPTTFAELVRISGLSHGTDVWLNNAQEFVRGGTATLSEIITVRDDIMNYLIDQGLDKGTSFKIMEFVRKGQPSKNLEAWENYSTLMKEHQVKDWYIESCGRIKYMFPKGHAVAYVMMAIRIAYFKVHFPIAFYAAYLSRKVDSFDYELMSDMKKVFAKVNELNKEKRLDVKQKSELALCEVIVEMKARGLDFLPINVYDSDGDKFTIEDGKIRIPLIGLNGLGGAVVENLLRERELGRFTSFEELKRRTKVSQTIIEKLKEFEAIEALNETDQITLF